MVEHSLQINYKHFVKHIPEFQPTVLIFTCHLISLAIFFDQCHYKKTSLIHS